MASKYSGLGLASTIVPGSQDSNKPTHDSYFGKGGYRTVNTINPPVDPEERTFSLLTIPSNYLEIGMLVYVEEDDIVYKLVSVSESVTEPNTTLLSDWVEFVTGISFEIPEVPIIESITEVNDKTQLVIKFNDDINIDYFELENKIGGKDGWGQIGKLQNDLDLTPDELGFKRMKVYDNTYQKKDVIYYRVRAVNSISYSDWSVVGRKDLVNFAYIKSESFSVIRSINGFNLTWENVNIKLLEKNIVYVEARSTDTGFDINNATVVYEGLQNHFNYLIKYNPSLPNEVDYYYKFWVIAKTRGVDL